MKNRIDGKWAFITGASSGIGKTTAEILASYGCNLILCARRKDRLEELKSCLIKKHNIEIINFELDIRDNEAVLSVAKDIDSKGVIPDFLINNAGLASGTEPIDEGFVEKWDAMIDTNLKGLLHVTRAILPIMRRKNIGHIINVGSTAGWMAYPGGNVYNATKFGVKGLSEAMNLDLVNSDIKVSCIAPGACETEFSLVRFDGDKQKADAVYANYKALDAEDIADAIVYILNAPSHVNITYLQIQATAQRNMYITRKEK